MDEFSQASRASPDRVHSATTGAVPYHRKPYFTRYAQRTHKSKWQNKRNNIWPSAPIESSGVWCVQTLNSSTLEGSCRGVRVTPLPIASLPSLANGRRWRKGLGATAIGASGSLQADKLCSLTLPTATQRVRGRAPSA